MTLATLPPPVSAPRFASVADWPAIGAYLDIPAEQYHALDAASATWLKAMAVRKPLHALYDMTHFKQTPDMWEGEVMHHFFLQPNLFSSRHHIADTCSAILKTGDKKGMACGLTGKIRDGQGNWFCGKHADGEADPDAITLELYERLKAVGTEVYRVAGGLLEPKGLQTEVSLIWKDADTGLLCKARLDILRFSDRIIADFKKVQNADVHAFTRDIFSRRYDIQEAHYLAGAEALFGGDWDFRFIGVELNENQANSANVVELDDMQPVGESGFTTRQLARIARQTMLRDYAQCKRSGVFPGYTNAVKPIVASRWVLETL